MIVHVDDQRTIVYQPLTAFQLAGKAVLQVTDSRRHLVERARQGAVGIPASRSGTDHLRCLVEGIHSDAYHHRDTKIGCAIKGIKGEVRHTLQALKSELQTGITRCMWIDGGQFETSIPGQKESIAFQRLKKAIEGRLLYRCSYGAAVGSIMQEAFPRGPHLCGGIVGNLLRHENRLLFSQRIAPHPVIREIWMIGHTETAAIPSVPGILLGRVYPQLRRIDGMVAQLVIAPVDNRAPGTREEATVTLKGLNNSDGPAGAERGGKAAASNMLRKIRVFIVTGIGCGKSG